MSEERKVLASGTRAKVAEAIGVSRTTLWAYIKKMPERFEIIGKYIILYEK